MNLSETQRKGIKAINERTKRKAATE